MQTAITPSGKKELWFVITASSVGTLIEWYDFYLFGTLATILSQQFFPKGNPTAAFLSTLATFAAGFIVRPFGALVFGRLGDLVGRKYTFLVTLILMGGSTFAIGLIPGYESIGIFAPILVVSLRLVQGLALGGEYGGAATYVAEHAPESKRGYYTSFIQTTATLGLFVSLGVILAVRESVGTEAFSEWGWRVPFLLSALLVIVSIYIRMKMHESPLFSKIKAEGKISANPLKESFTKKENLKMVLLALLGATAGQGVVWYTGQFYALTFLQKTCGLELAQSYYVIGAALILATPLFIVFGSWSDRVGRKYIMLAGMFLAVISYRPIYQKMYDLADINNKTEVTEEKSITTQSTKNVDGTETSVITTLRIFSDGTTERQKEKITTATPGSNQENTQSTSEKSRELNLGNDAFIMMIVLVFIQVFYVTMVYGPIAAFLVELFPTRIRYTSMSLPYHIGNGVFGGLTPFIATSLYESSKTTDLPGGDPFAGLWYPIAVAAISLVIGSIFLSNKKKAEVD
ncbi:MAG: MHS family MFS transporter [Bacteroidetes bacterium]|nr:MHS family MFS transporter [Bacteroidota bacterium]